MEQREDPFSNTLSRASIGHAESRQQGQLDSITVLNLGMWWLFSEKQWVNRDKCLSRGHTSKIIKAVMSGIFDVMLLLLATPAKAPAPWDGVDGQKKLDGIGI
ncbi:hypothetical protein OIU84_000365 [Salix udensis]|uniref:Uncharacterized protein n=1 Tax=Salix udensis TaxID=889485 RepID=A0AAD6L4P8_9ROSI|nr:hypothetical protein OIU84_000365 [Salix udensis]